jgi:hypothetical protein
MSTGTERRPYLDVDGEALTSVWQVNRQDGDGLRTVGVYASTPNGLRWHPAVDVQRLAERGQVLAALGVLAATVGWVARGWALGRPAVGRVTMGPGGWISVRVPREGGGRRRIGPHQAGRPCGPGSSTRTGSSSPGPPTGDDPPDTYGNRRRRELR